MHSLVVNDETNLLRLITPLLDNSCQIKSKRATTIFFANFSRTKHTQSILENHHTRTLMIGVDAFRILETILGRPGNHFLGASELNIESILGIGGCASKNFDDKKSTKMTEVFCCIQFFFVTENFFSP